MRLRPEQISTYHCWRSTGEASWRSTGEASWLRYVWHLIAPPSTSYFLAEVGVSLASGLVTYCCSQRTTCWRLACMPRWGSWEFATPAKARVGVGGLFIYNLDKDSESNHAAIYCPYLQNRQLRMATKSFIILVPGAKRNRFVIQIAQGRTAEKRSDDGPWKRLLKRGTRWRRWLEDKN